MSMSDQAPRQAGRKHLFRTVLAASTAAVLLGSSFYAAYAGGGGASQYVDDGDTDTAQVIGISLGVVAGTYLIGNLIANGAGAGSSSAEKEKTASAGSVEKVRVVPSSTGLAAGDTAVLQVQARYAGSKTWQDVTDNASLQLVSGGLTQVDGSKNAFAVPYGSKVVTGPAVVKASFGGQSATTQLSVN